MTLRVFLIYTCSIVSLQTTSNHNKTSGMVSRASLSFLFIAIRVVETKQRNLESWESILSVTGLLVVTETKLNRCRLCLIQKIGVDRIVLVNKNVYAYTYLIKGRITILENFVRQCSNVYICVIQFNVYLSYTPSPTLSLVEYGIDQFATRMYGAIDRSSRTILNSEKLPTIG